MLMKGKKRSITVKLLLLSGITSAAAVILVFPSAAAGGIADGMQYSAEMLIPSLFPFMVISSFLIRSGASDILGKLLAPVTKSLFRLPEESAAAIVMSFVGGFPVNTSITGVGIELYVSDEKGDMLSFTGYQKIGNY